jgi:uncharacterized membrane protein
MWFIFALCSAVAFSLMQIYEKKALKLSRPSEFMFARSLIVLLFLILMLPFFSLKIDGMAIPILAAIFIQLGFYLLLMATKGAEISKVSPFTNLTPLFVIVISILFLEELPSALQILGIMLIVSSTFIIESPWHMLIHGKKNVLYAIGTAVSWSIAGVFLRWGLTHLDVLTMIYTTEAAGALLALGVSLIVLGKKARNVLHHCMRCTIISGLALLLSNVLVYLAMSEPNGFASVAIAVRRTSTLFTVIIAGLVLKEHDFRHRILSTAIAVLGVFLVAIG